MFKDTNEGKTNYCEACEILARPKGVKNIGNFSNVHTCGMGKSPEDKEQPKSEQEWEARKRCGEKPFEQEVPEQEWEKKLCKLIFSLNIDKKVNDETNPWINEKMEKEIKSFIKENFISKKEVSNLSVSEWARIGKERGYWSYFKDINKAEIWGKIQKLKKLPDFDDCSCQRGYQKAIEDIEKIIE